MSCFLFCTKVDFRISIICKFYAILYSQLMLQRTLCGKEHKIMQIVLDNNQMKAAALQVSAIGIIPELAVVKDVRVSYVLDSEGKKTEKVDVIRYDCVNTDNFSTFTLKVETTHPIVTKEILEASEEPVYISIPVSEVVIRPYSIEYGNAKVSIIAPYVKLAEN